LSAHAPDKSFAENKNNEEKTKPSDWHLGVFVSVGRKKKKYQAHPGKIFISMEKRGFYKGI
jgi:hypothetical protein